MPIIVTYTREELEQKHVELIHVMHNLRFWSKYWHLHHGHKPLERKQYWEEKADRLLDEIGHVEHNNIKAILVIRQE